MFKSLSVKELFLKLRSLLNDFLSKLRNFKDTSVRHPFVIALLLSVLAHAIALAIPILSGKDADRETTEQVSSDEEFENDSEEDFEDSSEEDDLEEDLEGEGLEEGEEPLDVEKLPPVPDDEDLSDEVSDSGDDLTDDSDAADDSSDDTLDAGDESGDDTLDSVNDSSDDPIDSEDDSSGDDVVSLPTPSEPEFESEVETSNNIPEISGSDSGDISDSTAAETEDNTDTESNTEELTSSDVKTDENNPEEPIATSEPNIFTGVTDYKNARPLLCGLKVAQEDKDSRFTPDPLAKVSGYFVQSLGEQGYQPKQVADSSDTKVYQISKDGQDRFLHLFDQTDKGTVILLSQERIDCYRLNIQSLKPEDSQETNELEEIKSSQESVNIQESEKSEGEEKTEEPQESEEIKKSEDSEQLEELKKSEETQESEETEKKPELTPEEKAFENTFAKLYEELGWTKYLDTAEANKNQTPTPGTETAFNADVSKKSPDELGSIVKSKLEEQGFETSQVEDYTNGVLYEVKKGEFTKYITLTLNTDETKVMIVTWKENPIDSQKG
ncbi:hypothetical protein [Mastigocoleus testarum]|uniref:Uncharacterized protein n=1 Tax=Mastigocoleus testarum BC008 TaxID=371196 RepID=A0A0V7ZYX9_9CYAN|nr:hypothetical protein [Mastigocoleus testarum]KST69585.1 hypothetical protein BC008_04600 [Mastigocoleus testarum BC008]